MAEKVRCEICNRNFKNAEGLAQHNAAIHAKSAPESEILKPKISKRKVKNLAIFFIALIIIAALFVWLIRGYMNESRECKTMPAEKINIGGHQNLKLHIHSKLEILINGKKEAIPANIGVLPGTLRPIHTHDTSGEIHIEGPCQRDFTLGDFFKIWNKQFNRECIFEHCANNGSLEFKVNGLSNSDFQDYKMKNEDIISIIYNSSLIQNGK